MKLYTYMLLHKKTGKPPAAFTNLSIKFLEKTWKIRPKYRLEIKEFIKSFSHSCDVTVYPKSWEEHEERMKRGIIDPEGKDQAPWLTNVRGYGIPVSRTKEMQSAIDNIAGLKSYK